MRQFAHSVFDHQPKPGIEMDHAVFGKHVAESGGVALDTGEEGSALKRDNLPG